MLKRFEGNPILKPIPSHPWESKMVFNCGAIYLNDRFHILYRARDKKDISTFGYASSRDGFYIDERFKKPVFSPESEIDYYGCEDPRIVKIKDMLYITYTAYGKVSGMSKKASIQIGMTSISIDDFVNHRWNWGERIYPLPRVDNKDCVIFPEKIGGKYVIYHRIPPHIWVSYSDDLVHWYNHDIVMSPKDGWEYFKLGAGATPIKTKKGWLFIYHAVDKKMFYRLGFAFIDLNDPKKVIYRHPEPILSPEEKCEKTGVVANVVFTCGTVLKDGKVFVYYGGADTVIGVATADLDQFFKEAGF